MLFEVNAFCSAAGQTAVDEQQTSKIERCSQKSEGSLVEHHVCPADRLHARHSTVTTELPPMLLGGIFAIEAE